MKLISFLFAGSFFLLTSCSTKNNDETADLIITNARIYTVNENQPWAEAVAISDGIILKAGQSEDILKLEGPETQILDATGNFVMPGFIEGHGHFAGMGRSLMNLNFLKSRNWEEIVELVRERAQEVKPGEWIIGRGWHQEKWDHIPERQVLGYPYHDALSEVTPDNPVLLSHASGHALLANKAAMNAAGVSVETPDPSGGHIVRDGSGQAIGVFEENAERIIEAAYDQYLQNLSVEEIEKTWYKGIQLAQEECLANGVTSFQDAGSSFQDIQRYETLATEGKLDIRLWTMVRHGYDDLKSQISDFPILNAGNHFFTCRSIKASIDGALGSFGAWLLTPYLEKPGFSGQNTTEINELRRISKLAAEYNMQFCIHAIGDKANHEVLNIFENTFNEYPEKRDLRWRIEHAQHLDPDDIPRFSQLGVIASMQGIHCTSDAPYVVKRLGEKRAEDGAYVWRSLMDQGALVTNGTDVPVEDINPLESFYASVTRKRIDNGMEFYTNQKMTRKEAIHSYTLANAYAAFEEGWKGSIEEGKCADLVMLSNNLLECQDSEILETKVLMTVVDGNIKYSTLNQVE